MKLGVCTLRCLSHNPNTINDIKRHFCQLCKISLALTFPSLEMKLCFPLANLGENIKRKMWRKTNMKNYTSLRNMKLKNSNEEKE
jgi:hypothetical protein